MEMLLTELIQPLANILIEDVNPEGSSAPGLLAVGDLDHHVVLCILEFTPDLRRLLRLVPALFPLLLAAMLTLLSTMFVAGSLLLELVGSLSILNKIIYTLIIN